MNKFEKQKADIYRYLRILRDKLIEKEIDPGLIVNINSIAYRVNELNPPKIEFEQMGWFVPDAEDTERLAYAITDIVTYHIFRQGIVRAIFQGRVEHIYKNSDIENHIAEAKAICQAHHDALILSRIKK